MKRILLSLAIVPLLLAGCATADKAAPPPPPPRSFEEILNEAKLWRAAVDAGVAFYEALTRCEQTTAKLCYDPLVAQQTNEALKDIDLLIAEAPSVKATWSEANGTAIAAKALELALKAVERLKAHGVKVS